MAVKSIAGANKRSSAGLAHPYASGSQQPGYERGDSDYISAGNTGNYRTGAGASGQATPVGGMTPGQSHAADYQDEGRAGFSFLKFITCRC